LNALESTIGTVTYLEASVMKDWKKYAIHVIEPSLKILQLHDVKIKSFKKYSSEDKTTLEVDWENNIKTIFKSTGKNSTQAINIFFRGTLGELKLEFEDTFSAFKESLLTFVNFIRDGKNPIPRSHTLAAIKLVQKGFSNE
jgi:hypothetical protein